MEEFCSGVKDEHADTTFEQQKGGEAALGSLCSAYLVDLQGLDLARVPDMRTSAQVDQGSTPAQTNTASSLTGSSAWQLFPRQPYL